jgi:hypothetical protein
MQGRRYARKRNSDVLKKGELLEESWRSPIYTLVYDEVHNDERQVMYSPQRLESLENHREILA